MSLVVSINDLKNQWFKEVIQSSRKSFL